MTVFFTQFIQQPEIIFLITVIFYVAAEKIYTRYNKTALLHPLATACLPLGLLMLGLGVDKETYEHANNFLLFLLAPAVVTLGVPIYTYRHTIQRNFLPIMSSVVIGGIIAATVAVVIAIGVGAEMTTINALIAKSVTTPIAIEVVRFTQGNIPLIVTVVVFTGVFGAVFGPFLLAKMGITDEKVVGLTLGIVAHGVGTARAFDISVKAGAFASLGMALTGLFTAIAVGFLVFVGVI